MSGHNWILCERSDRWAAALRLALARSALPHQPPRIHETRNLLELKTRLESRPESLALVEVGTANFSDVLEYVADASRRLTSARFAALLDGSLTSPKIGRAGGRHHDLGDVRDALAEAGISAFADSPRRLQNIFALAGAHARLLASRAISPDNRPFADWARSLLPWQDA